MKLIYLIFLFFSNFIFSQSNVDSIIKRNKVKEVRVLDSKNNMASVTKYDISGRIVFNALDNFGGSTYLKTSITWIYDDLGNIIKTISTHSSFPDPTIWFYEYDANGNKISIKTEDGKFVFQYFYDNANFLIKELAYEDDNTIRRITTYEKFNDGKKIVSKMKGDTFIRNRTNTTYFDDSGNKIKNESYDGDKINFSTNSTYEKNRLIKSVYNSGEGSNYFYDSLGRLIKRQNFKIKNGVETSENFEEMSYNAEGLVETYRENIYSASSKIREYKYEYNYYN